VADTCNDRKQTRMHPGQVHQIVDKEVIKCRSANIVVLRCELQQAASLRSDKNIDHVT
jgi:hypothetical protein